MHIDKKLPVFNLEELPVEHWAISMKAKILLVINDKIWQKVSGAWVNLALCLVMSDWYPEEG